MRWWQLFFSRHRRGLAEIDRLLLDLLDLHSRLLAAAAGGLRDPDGLRDVFSLARQAEAAVADLAARLIVHGAVRGAEADLLALLRHQRNVDDLDRIREEATRLATIVNETEGLLDDSTRQQLEDRTRQLAAALADARDLYASGDAAPTTAWRQRASRRPREAHTAALDVHVLIARYEEGLIPHRPEHRQTRQLRVSQSRDVGAGRPSRQATLYVAPGPCGRGCDTPKQWRGQATGSMASDAALGAARQTTTRA